MNPILSYYILLVNMQSDFAVLFERRKFEVFKMKPLKEKISITIDGDLLDKLKEHAENDERSLSQYINLVLRKHINAQNERNHSPK